MVITTRPRQESVIAAGGRGRVMRQEFWFREMLPVWQHGEEKKVTRQGAREGEGGWNHLSRGEPNEELDCMLPTGVIVKAPRLRKRYIAPRTQLRNPAENPYERSSRRIKKQLILKASLGVSYRSLGLSEWPCLMWCQESWEGWGK